MYVRALTNTHMNLLAHTHITCMHLKRCLQICMHRSKSKHKHTCMYVLTYTHIHAKAASPTANTLGVCIYDMYPPNKHSRTYMHTHTHTHIHTYKLLCDARLIGVPLHTTHRHPHPQPKIQIHITLHGAETSGYL